MASSELPPDNSMDIDENKDTLAELEDGNATSLATLSLHKNHPPHIVNTVTENDEQADATKKHEGQSEAEWRVKELVKLCEHYEVMKAELVARGASRDEMQEAAQKFVADASDIVL